MFIGTPIFEQISPSELRITGLTLPANNATNDSPDSVGTLAFADASGTQPAPDVLLPDTFVAPSVVSFNGQPVALRALVKVDINPESAGPFTNLQPSVQKTGEGSGFRIAVTNTKSGEATQTLEIYLTLRGQGAQSAGIAINVQESPDTRIEINTGR